MTIGDVLAVIGLITGLGISSWAVMVAVALLCNRKANVARDIIATSPWTSLGYGLLMLVGVGFLAIALLSQPFPLIKFFGWSLLTVLFAGAAIGASGFALLAGSRIRLMDSSMTDYQALTRGSAVVLISAMTPVLGTFLIGPAGFALSLGAGVRALLTRAENPHFEIA